MDKDQEKLVIDQMDMLLDKNLSDVEDLPEYLDKVPTGYYKLKIEKRDRKVVEVPDKDKPGTKKATPVVQFVYSIMEVLELEKPEETENVKIGSRFNESIFFGDVEKGAQVVKAKFKEVAEAQGIANVKELLDKVEGLEVVAFVKTTKDKEKDDKYYIRVSNVKLA